MRTNSTPHQPTPVCIESSFRLLFSKDTVERALNTLIKYPTSVVFCLLYFLFSYTKIFGFVILDFVSFVREIFFLFFSVLSVARFCFSEAKPLVGEGVASKRPSHTR